MATCIVVDYFFILKSAYNIVFFWIQKYNAKLSDFGLAKDGPTGDKSHVSTRVMGTYGYAAPEYLATGNILQKQKLLPSHCQDKLQLDFALFHDKEKYKF